VERNLRLYPLYRALHGAIFWLPVFFLYFSSVLEPAQVLRLEAAYYFAVVLLEVPLGWFSDRLGRRPTLMLSAACWAAGCAVFAATASWPAFLGAQLLLAAGMALNSGTDSALLYDSLKALDQEGRVLEFESRAQVFALLATGGAALVGGFAAGFDLRLGHGLSVASALGALVIASRFAEPPRRAAPSVRSSLRQLSALPRQPALAWLLLASVAAVVINHVPYELMQPYLDLMLRDIGGYRPTPAVAGALVGISLVVASWASSRAQALAGALGGPGALIAALGLQGLLVALLASVLHPAIALALGLRSVPQALFGPILASLVHPRVDSSLRATWLSVQSLVGRLAFSGWLAWAASSMDALDHPAMAALLWPTLMALAVTLAVLLGTRRFVR